MAHQVIWTHKVMTDFERLGNLNEFQIKILESRVKNMTVVQQSQMLNCSESLIHKEIAKIKKIYDAVQEEYPDQFPIRKKSSKELYMDTH